MSPPPSDSISSYCSISIHCWIYSCFVLSEQLLPPRPKRLRLQSCGRVASFRRDAEGLSTRKLVLSAKVFSRTRRHKKGRGLTAPAPYTSPLLARLGLSATGGLPVAVKVCGFFPQLLVVALQVGLDDIVVVEGTIAVERVGVVVRVVVVDRVGVITGRVVVGFVELPIAPDQVTPGVTTV